MANFISPAAASAAARREAIRDFNLDNPLPAKADEWLESLDDAGSVPEVVEKSGRKVALRTRRVDHEGIARLMADERDFSCIDNWSDREIVQLMDAMLTESLKKVREQTPDAPEVLEWMKTQSFRVVAEGIGCQDAEEFAEKVVKIAGSAAPRKKVQTGFIAAKALKPIAVQRGRYECLAFNFGAKHRYDEAFMDSGESYCTGKQSRRRKATSSVKARVR